MIVRFSRTTAIGALGILLCATGGSLYAEILPMTRERLQEAEEVGRKAVKDSAIVYQNTCRTRGRHLHMFDVTITTPFSSLAYVVFESKKKGLPFDPAQWPIEPAQNQFVIISVDPASLYPAGLPPSPPISVRKVLLRRGEQLIEPRRTDTHEVQFPDFIEKYRRQRGGAFYFSLEPFASEAGDLEVVVIPELDEPDVEGVLKLKKSELAKLR